MNVQERIAKLSLEEKAALLQGWTTWTTLAIQHADIPEVFLSDGPHGLRKQEGASDHLGLNASVPATCFPPAASMANTWNPDLGEKLGEALGKEAAAHDIPDAPIAGTGQTLFGTSKGNQRVIGCVDRFVDFLLISHFLPPMGINPG